MTWDSELEQLAVDVSELYGERALTDAMIRALHSAHEHGAQVRARTLVLVPGQLEAALRTELRKLLVVH
jgi:hypothetical protein